MDYVFISCISWIVLELAANVNLKQATFKVFRMEYRNSFSVPPQQRLSIIIHRFRLFAARPSQNLRLAGGQLREFNIHGIPLGLLRIGIPQAQHFQIF